MKKILESMLDRLRLNSESFQGYINARFDDPDRQVIDNKYLTNAICEYKGLKWIVNYQLRSVDDVLTYFQFSDIKPDDIVLDVGACIGAFTLFAAQKSKQVYAFEPLFYDVLQKNVELNGFRNVKVFNIGLGTQPCLIQFHGAKAHVNCEPLSKIIDMCGGHIDFLKCNCEGAEWLIKPDEFDGIRRIEMEVHLFNGENFSDYLYILKSAGFHCVHENLIPKIEFVHATRK